MVHAAVCGSSRISVDHYEQYGLVRIRLVHGLLLHSPTGATHPRRVHEEERSVMRVHHRDVGKGGSAAGIADRWVDCNPAQGQSCAQHGEAAGRLLGSCRDVSVTEGWAALTMRHDWMRRHVDCFDGSLWPIEPIVNRLGTLCLCC